mmetsp:Transcript_30165/g.69627  ORF Transcript_30165/g.69627 Transcript_30165/m.69627 type:complete len:133 (+) Transcript_30165:301-699(+)
MGGRGFLVRSSRPSASSEQLPAVDAKLFGPDRFFPFSPVMLDRLERGSAERVLSERLPAPRLDVEHSEGRRAGAETWRCGRFGRTGLACCDPRPCKSEFKLGSRDDALKVRWRSSGEDGTFCADCRLSTKLP